MVQPFIEIQRDVSKNTCRAFAGSYSGFLLFQAGEAIASMNEKQASEILQSVDPEKAANILMDMETASAAKVLGSMKTEAAAVSLSKMEVVKVLCFEQGNPAGCVKVSVRNALFRIINRMLQAAPL